MGQQYIDLYEDGTCGFYNSDIHSKEQIPSTAVTINYENYITLLNGLNSQHQLIYIDYSIIPDGTGNQFKLREKYTKWNGKNWVSDEDAINKVAHDILVIQAKEQFAKYDLSAYRLSKLKDAQKKALISYLDSLDEIINGDVLNTTIYGKDIKNKKLPTAPF